MGVSQIPRREPENLKAIMEYSEYHKGLAWTVDRGPKTKAGSIVGCIVNGYRTARLDGIYYRLEDLVWFYFHGHIPKYQIIHKNGDPLDNRIENLELNKSVIRRKARRPSKKRNKPGPPDEEIGATPEKKLVAAIIKDALKDAKRLVKKKRRKIKRPLTHKEMLNIEPVRWLMNGGNDLTELAGFSRQTIRVLTHKTLKEVNR